MAKKYYTVDEAKAKLGLTEDGIKGLVSDGKLREFRDGGKIHFKVDDVDKLAVETGGGSAESSLPGLELADETETPSLSGTDSGEITLEPVEDDTASLSGSGSSFGLAEDEGSSASDAGLVSLEDSEAAQATEGSAQEVTLDDSTSKSSIRKDDTIITSTGVSVFDDDLEHEADPAADTVLTASASDQVALEGIGSGSGLLDLTREADDTSLGAELLDEILPGGGETRLDEGEPIIEAEVGGTEMAEAPTYGPMTAPVVVVDDPFEPMITGVLVVALVMLTLAGAVAGAFVQGTWPGYLQTLYANFGIAFGASMGVAALVFAVGFFLCRSKARR